MAEAFLKDQITIGHALLIAKLPASQQQEGILGCLSGLVDKRGQQPSPDSSPRIGLMRCTA
ncbi:MAG TPA: hypothetical protein VH350_02705 [Candidatus Sulfotelmatobacter sp.]|nr:hypothetical protein [Candidatus Sulfotelmatobacter sp.]